MLPLAIQVHHAAADGFHVSRLVRELEELLADPRWIGCGSGDSA
jgi:chloramphenicol O-acetyltransferase type A